MKECSSLQGCHAQTSILLRAKRTSKLRVLIDIPRNECWTVSEQLVRLVHLFLSTLSPPAAGNEPLFRGASTAVQILTDRKVGEVVRLMMKSWGVAVMMSWCPCAGDDEESKNEE